MGDIYLSGSFDWVGRVDGNAKEQLRWHQVVKKIDLDKTERFDKKGFCIIGFKSDAGVKRNKGRAGARFAPDTIRKYLSSMPWYFNDINLYDAGDVICEDNLESAQSILGEKVNTIFDMGLFPIILGGGHEVAFGSIMGFYKHFNKMPSIVNFDAHFDMRSYENGASSGTSFRQIADICKKNSQAFKYLCIGIQKSSNTQELFDCARSYSAKWIDMEMIRFNEKAALSKLDTFLNDSEDIHLTICMDAFAQSIAHGVSAPQPFGMNVGEFLTFFYYVLKSSKVRSFDIAEISPPLDLNDETSLLGANIIFRLADKTAGNLS